MRDKIVDWSHNLYEHLRKSVNDGLDKGLFQLNIMFYINNSVVIEEYINCHLNYLTEQH